MSSSKIKIADEFCQDYKKFLNECKTEREVISFVLAFAKSKGFEEFNPEKTYESGEKIFLANRGKSAVFCVIGKNKTKRGTKLIVSHVDSPRIDLKPNPLYEMNNVSLFKTHYYGGIKKYQWLTLPLALHGRIMLANGKAVDLKIGEDEEDPVFCITDLLPHIGKDMLTKKLAEAFFGENLNAIVGSRKLSIDGETSCQEKDCVRLNILEILNRKYSIVEEDFLSAELELVPAAKARDVGFDRSMIGSYGHDDKVCVYTSFMALLDADCVPEKTTIVGFVDKEEIGSEGNTSMKSRFLEYFVEDLADRDNMKVRHVLSKSKCLSADVNPAFDSNFANYFEQKNSSFINNGVVLTKYTGSLGKNGSSDASAEFLSEIRTFIQKNNILWQTGELGRVDDGGGGTVAKYVANLNVDVVDVGIPVLSMHAPMEVVSKIDVYSAYLTFKNFLQ
jgi:aspartyl aminopeptidase